MAGPQTAAARPERAAADRTLRLELLGGFALFADGEPVDLAELSKRLLVFLALRERPQRRAFVAGSLWPEKPEERAAANLRAALWRLPALHPEPLVRSYGREVALSSRVEVDLRTAEEIGWGLVRRGELPDDVDAHLFSADLLPGWYDEWLIVERERLSALQLHFLDALATQLLERNRLAEALDVAHRLVAADPLRESSHRVLITVYLADGNRHEARAQLDRCREVLRETFSCEPSPGLFELVD